MNTYLEFAAFKKHQTFFHSHTFWIKGTIVGLAFIVWDVFKEKVRQKEGKRRNNNID